MDLRLVSFDLCPYVERSRIALHEKGLDYAIDFIDLRAKPDWFLRISPMGKVPVLVADQTPIFESAVINEYLDEQFPQAPLFPRTPLARAEARGWIVFLNDTLMPAGFKAQVAMAAGKREEAEKLLPAVRDALGKLDKLLEEKKGPHILGDIFTLVDICLAPFFRRWLPSEEWLGTYVLRDFPRLEEYAKKLLERDSVKRADPGEVGPRMKQLLVERYASPKA